MVIVFLSSLVFSALVILSISMTKHYRQIFNKPLAKQHIQPIRRTGWLLMAVAIILAIYNLDFGVGLATFFSALAFVGFIHVWLLSYAKQYLVPLALLMPFVSFWFLVW